MESRILICFLGAVLLPGICPAQDVPAPGVTLSAIRSGYILGPADQLTIFVADLEDFNDRPVQVDLRGDVNLPVAGRVHAAGLTTDRLEKEIEKRLSTILNEPRVVVEIRQFHSQPVSVLGSVNSPGEHQLEGRKTLFAILSAAGGLRADAGNAVKVTRSLKWGRIPLPNAQDDPTGQYSVASVSAKSIINATDPAENIVIRPEDVISVTKADLVYCVGSVHKPGGFAMGEAESLSALQVLSLAEGLDRNAAPQQAKILRAVPGSSVRTEVALNLKKLMAGKGSDLALKSGDILFIPNSAARSALARTSEAAIQIATGVAIYGRL
ncbi:MAG TPA: polysaccharide biosynthesis/export family protein [Bryobacteraceae bacterium]|nr:polysaccharide biosynthesis/export family protein [Bryobacteraceae bacterium]